MKVLCTSIRAQINETILSVLKGTGMSSRFGTVSAKAILLVIVIIVLCVASCTALLLNTLKVGFGDARMQQNLNVAEQIINPGHQPYHLENGRLMAGQQVLNGDTAAIQAITSSLGGVATIFAGDTRVATNIRRDDGQPVTGSKLAQGAEYTKVFGKGETFLGQSTLFGNQYVSAYMPLKNAQGETVGVLFVGYDLKAFNAPVAEAERQALYAGLALILIGMLITILCFRYLLAPFKGLHAAMEEVKSGRFSTEVPYTGRADEFGEMARMLQDFNLSMQKQIAHEAAQKKAEAEAAAKLKLDEEEAQHRNEKLVVSTFGAGLEALAQGNLSYRLEGELPEAYRGLQENFNSAIASFDASNKAHAEAQEKMAAERDQAARDQIAAAKKAQDDAMNMVVESFGTSLKAMASRDLSVRVDADLPAGYDALKGDYNTSLDILADAMDDIEGRAADIASNTKQLSQATQEMAQRTERQAASLEETAAAMEEVSANVKKSAENASEASKSASDAHKGAEEGNAVAKDTIAAMRNIAQSSSEITQIIGVIDDIAFQTNLLALNAGVEAARAGDAGRGFAVVASEVRGLAQRSAEAAKQIKALIHTSEHQVEKGVKLVEKSGEALDGIVSDLSRIHILMTEIATAQQEQANAFSEINSAISSMDQTTQQNAAMNEESTAASAAIANHARELADLIDSFTTGRRAGDRQMADAEEDVADAAMVPPRGANANLASAEMPAAAE